MHVMKRVVSSSKNNFLNDHQIKGNKVLPMAVAVTSIAERAMHLYQGYSLVSISDTQLFAGITINNEITTDLKVEELKTSTDNTVQLKCLLSTYNKQKKRCAPGYRCTVVLSSQRPVKPSRGTGFKIGSTLLSQYNTRSLYNGTTLFHGPTFQDVVGVLKVNSKSITVQCNKGNQIGATYNHAVMGQYNGTKDSIALDVVMQTFLIWARHERNVAALPTGAKTIEYYGSLVSGKDYYITLSGEDNMNSAKDATWNATFNVHDAAGYVYIRGSASVTLHDNLKY